MISSTIDNYSQDEYVHETFWTFASGNGTPNMFSVPEDLIRKDTEILIDSAITHVRSASNYTEKK